MASIEVSNLKTQTMYRRTIRFVDCVLHNAVVFTFATFGNYIALVHCRLQVSKAHSLDVELFQ